MSLMFTRESQSLSLVCSDEQITQKFINPLKILNLCSNLSSHTSTTHVQVLINKFLQQVTNSPYVFIIPILSNTEEGLIQVIGDKILDKEIRFTVTADNIRGASVNGFQFRIDDLDRDFRDVIKSLVGTTHNTLFFDIRELNKNAKSILMEMLELDEISAKSSATGLTNCSTLYDDLTFISGENYLQISCFIGIAGDESCRIYYRYCIYETLRFTIGHLLAAIELNEERRVHKQCKRLLTFPRSLVGILDCELVINREGSGSKFFTIAWDLLKSSCIPNKYVFEPRDFYKILQSVMADGTQIAGAQYATLHLREKNTGELISLAYDIYKNPINAIEIKKSLGIAGHVINSGEIVNIRNVDTNSLFNRDIDGPAGYKIRNILSFPIYNQNDIIGVGQFCNKENGNHFDKRDEQTAAAFGIFISIGISHALVQISVQKAEVRHNLAQELFIYHMKISEDEVSDLATTFHNIEQKKIPNLSSFTFRTRELDYPQTMIASLQMLTDLDFVRKFKIRRDKLARFLITIRRAYRDLKFHNWMHAFTVAHFAYTLILNGGLIQKGILSDLEAFSFVISAFCHDIDHRGLTNSFQMDIQNNLARLYYSEGSINERHHLSQTIYLLHHDNIKICDGLTIDQFKRFLKFTKEFILSTDLAHHLHILKQLSNLRKGNCIETKQNKHMTMSLFITTCDLSDQIQEWPNAEHVAELVYYEFFAQGDLERQLGKTPAEMMDRKRSNIPLWQINFINFVITPAFEILANILPETYYLLDIIKDNLAHWHEIRLAAQQEQ